MSPFERSSPWESLPEGNNSSPVILLVWYLDSGEVYSIRGVKDINNKYTAPVYAKHLMGRPPFGKIEVMSSFTTKFKQAFTVEQRDKLWKVVEEKRKQINDWDWDHGKSISLLGNVIK